METRDPCSKILSNSPNIQRDRTHFLKLVRSHSENFLWDFGTFLHVKNQGWFRYFSKIRARGRNGFDALETVPARADARGPERCGRRQSCSTCQVHPGMGLVGPRATSYHLPPETPDPRTHL